MSENLIELKNICKSFGEEEVLHDFNLYIKENEFVTLLGPSGCGKTTLLRMIAGFDQPSSGEIIFEGKVINDVEPNKRPINTVFQRYALFPHLNVFDNVAFGLWNQNITKYLIKQNVEKDYFSKLNELKDTYRNKNITKESKIENKKQISELKQEIRNKYKERIKEEIAKRLAKVEERYSSLSAVEKTKNSKYKYEIKCAKSLKISKYEVEERVRYALKLVHLDEYANRKIDTLSGGQQQRVAMARAIVMKPKLLLLDEPLAALDRKLRQDLQYELKEMQRTLGITFVFVTHDQEEALTMSDTIVVMNEGRILQIGTPEMIYNEPKTRFVANFIGESNIIDAVVPKDGYVKFDNALFKTTYETGFSKNEEVDVVLRPEDILVVPADGAKLKGTIDSKIFKGDEYEVNVIVESGREYTIHTTKDYELGLFVGLTIDPENITIMKKPGINTYTGVIDEDGNVKISDDMILEFGDEEDEEKEELEEGTNVVVRISTADVLLDDIEESDFTGIVKDIKKRDLYYDVYIKVGENIIVSSTSKVHKVGEETGIWVKPEKVFVKVEKEDDEEESSTSPEEING